MLRTAVLVLALAALVAPPARADTFDVSGDLKLSEAPITTGDVTVGGPGLLTFSAPSDGGDLFRLQCDACDVEVIQVDSTLVDPHPFLPPDYQINTYPRQTPGTPRITLHDAELVGRTPSRWFLAAADFPDPAQLASLEQPRFELRPRQDNYSMQSDDTPGSFPFTYATPGGSLRANWVQGANTSVTATGAAELAFRGLHIHAASQEGEFDWTLGKEYTWIAGTPAGGTVFHFNVTYLIVRAHQPQLVLPAGMSAAFTSRAMTIATQDGRIDLRGSGGWTRIGGADRPVRTFVSVTGSVTATARVSEAGSRPVLSSQRSGTTVAWEGKASRVVVDGIVLEASSSPIPLASSAILLGLVLAWITGVGGKIAAATVAATGTMPRDKALLHERRLAIYRAVLHNPGVHLRQVQRLTGLRWASLQYHAGLLIAAGLLREVKAERHRVLLCAEHRLTEDHVRALHLLRGPTAGRIAFCLTRPQELTQADIARVTGITSRLVNYYLVAMVQLGLLDVNPTRPKRYRGTELLLSLLPQAVHGPSSAMSLAVPRPLRATEPAAARVGAAAGTASRAGAGAGAVVPFDGGSTPVSLGGRAEPPPPDFFG